MVAIALEQLLEAREAYNQLLALFNTRRICVGKVHNLTLLGTEK